MAAGIPQMGGLPPQGGGQQALGQLAKKPSSPDSGAPLLQMIMTFLAGSGLKDVASSLSTLMKHLQPGDKTHHKQPGMPPGVQPSKPGMPPAGPQGGPTPPPGLVASQGAPPPGGAPPGGMDIMKLIQMLMGGGQPPQQ